MSDELLPLEFVARRVPLAPRAVAARGEAALRLAERVLREPDEALASLRGVAGPGLLVLLGDEAALPWVDGAVYLGRDPDEPSLHWPTARGPDVHPVLAARALRERAKVPSGPLAVLLDPPLLVPLESAQRLSRGALTRFAGRERERKA